MPPRWSGEEDRTLRRLYGGQGAPLRVIAERVGRSQDAVSERRRALGIAPRPRMRPWSPVEDELMRAGTALGLSAAEIAARLRRAPEQVRRRRRALLGSARAPVAFTVAEDHAIAECWTGSGDVEALARALGRSAGSLRLRAQKRGLHRPQPRRRWRAYEDAAVRDGYERGLTCAQIAAELAGRSAPAVAARAAKLGLATYARTWTPREDRDLRQLARDGIALGRAAQLLARTPEALRARARKLGMTPPRPARAGQAGRRWTAREDELLRLHGALNPAALAELLDRSPEAITQRLRRLGLRAGAERSPHHPAPARGGLTPGQRAAVARELRTGGPGRKLALARRLAVPTAAIRRVTNPAATMNTSDALARARVIGADLGGRREHPQHYGPAAGT
jgi:hypothetical protein